MAVGNKSLIDQIEPQMPAHIHTGHFNNLRGLIHFGNLRQGVIIGRPMPSGEAMVEICISILGRPPVGNFTKMPDVRPVMIDGDLRFENATRMGYPNDPEATGLLDQIVTAELIQVVGRWRAVNAAEPVQIKLMGSTILTLGNQVLPVAKATPWAGCGRDAQLPNRSKPGVSHTWATAGQRRLIQTCFRVREQPNTA